MPTAIGMGRWTLNSRFEEIHSKWVRRWCGADIDSRADAYTLIRSLLCRTQSVTASMRRERARVMFKCILCGLWSRLLSISPVWTALNIRHTRTKSRLAATPNAALTHPSYRYVCATLCSVHAGWLNKRLAIVIIRLRLRLHRHVKILYGVSANDAMTMTLSMADNIRLFVASLVCRARNRYCWYAHLHM